MKKTQALTVTIHFIGWILFLCFPFFFNLQNHSESNFWFIIRTGTFCLYFISFFYCNTGILIPRLYLGGKQAVYFALIAAFLVITAFIKPFDRLIATHREEPPREQFERPRPDVQEPEMRKRRPGGGPGMPVDILSIVLFLLVWAVGYALQLVALWRNTEMRVANAEAERSRAELSFLKARINPHFLFNTLNNIYSMAVLQHPETATSIMKLSQIMRYLTDDIVNDFVLLENELECIENYISLQQLRLTRNSPVSFEVAGTAGGKMIAPLILMPFIENVFKYGVSNHLPSPINIKLDLADESIYFHCSNRVFQLAENNIERSGVGVENTRQRLELLYPERHRLLIRNTGELFTVELTIYFPKMN